MNQPFYLVSCICTLLLSLPLAGQQLPLSTTSDSCLYYYYQGWEMVMDHGNYTASEVAYRKAVSFDPDFLVGQSLLGRISSDLEEREAILAKIKAREHMVTGDEKLLLDVFTELLQLMIIREKNPEAAGAQLKKALNRGEENLGIIAHQYPDDIYYKAEYIEVINYNHGPQAALDSLQALATEAQLDNPFLLGFSAILEAELGQYESALKKSVKLDRIFKGRQAPKPHVVYASVYHKRGKIKRAQRYVKKALAIDPGCLDAQRLQRVIRP